MNSPVPLLIAVQNQDGGWGYGTGTTSIVEATAAVLFALESEPSAKESCRRGVDWLLKGQHTDGGWGYSQDDPESTWHTSWAVWVLAHLGEADSVIASALKWLLKINVFLTEDDALQRDILNSNGVDITIPGWAWLPGEVTWVEPTAFALLALQAINPTSAIRARTVEGARCLVSRRCMGGGWNVGVPVMLGANMPPRPVPTALCMLALSRLSRDYVVSEDLTTLKREMAADGGVLGLGWGLIALHALGQTDNVASQRLMDQQRTDTSWGNNPYFSAIAWLGLSGAQVLQ